MSMDAQAKEAIISDRVEKKIEDFEVKSSVEDMTEGMATEGQKLNIDLSFLRARTGEGRIDDYVNHPLNFSGSRGVAQILRGCTGMLGELDLAIVDIVVGGFNVIREKGAVNYGSAERGQ